MKIDVVDLCKTYKTGTKALNGVSFTIKSGEIFGLLGVNGSGKTTCSTILAMLHPATSGTVLFDGKNAAENKNEYKMRVGYCPQHPTLNDLLTVYDNLYYGALYFGMSSHEAKKSTEKIIDMFGLSKHLNNLPDTLSGGFKQRVMIGRSMIHNPDLVLLDEPTVGLDPDIRKQLWSMILELKKDGKSVVLTTHYLDEAEELCDTICILHQGRVIKLATQDELIGGTERNLEDVFIELTQEANKEDL